MALQIELTSKDENEIKLRIEDNLKRGYKLVSFNPPDRSLLEKLDVYFDKYSVARKNMVKRATRYIAIMERENN